MLVIDQGYIYILTRDGNGLRSIDHWRIVDLFKVFVDPEESALRFVVKGEEGQLKNINLESTQLVNIIARLREQASSIGLSLI